jgi:hypothetical protein
LDWHTDLGVTCVHNGTYNHGTKHRWDVSPSKKTGDGRRLLIEVTHAHPVLGVYGQRGYWTNLQKKVNRARRQGDTVIVLKFYGIPKKRWKKVCDTKILPELIRNGIYAAPSGRRAASGARISAT